MLDIAAKHDLDLRRLLAYYLAASVATLLARDENNEFTDTARYARHVCLIARRHRQVIDGSSFVKQDLERWPDKVHDQLATVLVFEFESVCVTQDWNSVMGLVEATMGYKLDRRCFPAMADLLIQSAETAPPDLLATQLDKMAAALNASGKLNIVKAAQWHRVLMSTYVDAENFVDSYQPEDERRQALLRGEWSLMTKIVELVHAHRRTYPIDALHYLASRSMNHAIELSNRNQRQAAHRWCDWATKLARASDDQVYVTTIDNAARRLFAPSPSPSPSVWGDSGG